MIILISSIPEPTVRESVYTQYHNIHRCCPTCGSQDVETTCKGVIFTDLQTAVDNNRAVCACGWRGIVHELVPDRN